MCYYAFTFLCYFISFLIYLLSIFCVQLRFVWILLSVLQIAKRRQRYPWSLDTVLHLDMYDFEIDTDCALWCVYIHLLLCVSTIGCCVKRWTRPVHFLQLSQKEAQISTVWKLKVSGFPIFYSIISARHWLRWLVQRNNSMSSVTCGSRSQPLKNMHVLYCRFNITMLWDTVDETDSSLSWATERSALPAAHPSHALPGSMALSHFLHSFWSKPPGQPTSLYSSVNSGKKL